MSLNNQDNENAAGPNTATACPMCGAAVAGDASRCEACGEELRLPEVPTPINLPEELQQLGTDCRVSAYVWFLFSVISFFSAFSVAREGEINPIRELNLVAVSGAVPVLLGILWFVAAVGAARRSPRALSLGIAISALLLVVCFVQATNELVVHAAEIRRIRTRFSSLFLVAFPMYLARRAIRRMRKLEAAGSDVYHRA